MITWDATPSRHQPAVQHPEDARLIVTRCAVLVAWSPGSEPAPGDKAKPECLACAGEMDPEKMRNALLRGWALKIGVKP